MPTEIDQETQKMLNKPLAKSGLSPEDQTFLNLVLSKVEKGEINLMTPGSLVNQNVYEKLPEEAQGKVDFDAVNLAATLRNIYGLWKANPTPTYEIENMVHQVRLLKERLEQISGDVYVI